MYRRFSAILPILLIAVASAQPPTHPFHSWKPPSGSDVRGPCPGLNSLANHGLIPQTGRNISLSQAKSGLSFLNVGSDIGDITFGPALVSLGRGLDGTLNLDELDRHNVLEHDASLSRADFNLTGDDHTFRQDIFDTVLAFFNGSDFTSQKALGQARMNRVLQSYGTNPAFSYNGTTAFLSQAETSLYSSVLGDPTSGAASVCFVKIFFEQERFPVQEGWHPTELETNLSSLLALNKAIQAAAGEGQIEAEIIAKHS